MRAQDNTVRSDDWRNQAITLIENWPVRVNECYRDFTSTIGHAFYSQQVKSDIYGVLNSCANLG